MAKSKKLFLVMLFTLFVSDICKYIKIWVHQGKNSLISFEVLITRFQHGFVLNKAVIFLLVISLIYFMINFFRNDND